MKIFMYLFIKFLLIYNCICVENDVFEIDYNADSTDTSSENDGSGTLILIKNLKNNYLNSIFLSNIMGKISNVQEIDIFPEGVMGTINSLNLYPNAEIVNLGVNDFYKYNYNNILNSGLNYGGEIDDSIETFPSYVIDMKGCDQNIGNIGVKNQTLRPVKLFSNRGIVDPIVYDYIYDFQGSSNLYYNYKYTVLVCLYHSIKNIYHIKDLIDRSDLKFEFTWNCENDMSNIKDLLAVITQTPLVMDDQMPVPIVLYSIPIAQLNSLSYKYFTTLTSNNPVEVFKSALLQFMKNVGWQRIAILSDNYDHSVEFERNLVSTFDKEGVMYAVFRCEENLKGNYNFSEVLNTLDIANARIVILNMDEKNIKRLSEQMRNHPSYYNRVWILRDKMDLWYSQNLGNVLSINLGPAIRDTVISDKIDSFQESPVNEFQIKAIYDCVTRVQRAYDNIQAIKNKDDNSLLYVYRKLNEKLRSTPNTGTQVYITYQTGNNDPKLLASMLFDGVKIIKENYDTQSKSVPTDMEECALRSRNFFKPCNYFEIIYFMFVLVVFFPILFTVVTFFSDRNITHERRNYRNL